MSDTIIKVEGLYKKFCFSLKHSMLYGAHDVARAMIGRQCDRAELRKNEFWALQDVHFELRTGDVLGIVGHNGSGKTTLLRLLNGIFPPDRGQISVRGRIGALIAVGAGFHPHMTGRENIFLNATILGMTKKEISRTFDAIIDFADIGEFIDSPVSTYSSGMTVRLGFAIAIHSSPDIVLVDEILAVGDAKFQRKCLDKIQHMRNKGVTFFLVSHNTQNIDAMCNQALLLDHGRQIAYGSPQDIIPEYELLLKTGKFIDTTHAAKHATPQGHLGLVNKFESFGTSEIQINAIYMKDCSGTVKLHFLSDESVTVEAEIEASCNIAQAILWLTLIYVNDSQKNDTNIVCLGTKKDLQIAKGKSMLRITFPDLQVTTGEYKISINFFDNTFSTPYFQGHYGYFTVKKDIPTLLQAGSRTPLCWAKTHLEILAG
ncbi:MAG: ATP-binding cassette domain-containing protein [Deltaproteobacteria bacterium]|nr:ATP-binding cassette domain-containing protein [Deltaproteobacteria bacterium]